MSKVEAKKQDDLLRRSANEINSLRRQNEILSAKMDVFDSMMCLLFTTPASRGGGMSPDIAWEIEKHLEEKAKKENA